MQAVVIREVGGFELADVPVPEPGPGEALVRVSVTGLCRTDLKIVRHGHRDLTLPRVPGEEVVGEIVALGPAGEAAALPRDADGRAAAPDARPFAPGDRVYVYPGVWCGECPSCRSGAENLCRQMRIMGFHRDGGFAEYVAAPLQSLIRVPDGLGDEEAVFAEPLSCCLNALELGRVGEGDVLGVWGAGPAGTLLSRAGALRGAEVVVVEPDERRREFFESAPGAPARASAHAPRPSRSTSPWWPSATRPRTRRRSRRWRRAAASSCSPASCRRTTRRCTSASAPCTTTSTPSSAPTAAASATASSARPGKAAVGRRPGRHAPQPGRRLRGAEVVVVEPDERRREFFGSAPGAPARASAHAAAPVPLDVAVVAVGDPAAYEAAIAALAPRGRLVVFSGLLPADDAALHVSLSAVHYHEHTFVGAYGCSFRHGVEALDLLASRRLRVDDLISHRLPLADLDEGLDLVARRAGMKIHLYPKGTS